MSDRRKITLRFPSLRAFLSEYGARIAADGILLRGESPPAAGSAVDIEVMIADGMRLLRARGETLWRGPNAAAVRFDELDEASCTLIDRILEQRRRDGAELFRLEEVPGPREARQRDLTAPAAMAPGEAKPSPAGDDSVFELAAPPPQAAADLSALADAGPAPPAAAEPAAGRGPVPPFDLGTDQPAVGPDLAAAGLELEPPARVVEAAATGPEAAPEAVAAETEPAPAAPPAADEAAPPSDLSDLFDGDEPKGTPARGRTEAFPPSFVDEVEAELEAAEAPGGSFAEVDTGELELRLGAPRDLAEPVAPPIEPPPAVAPATEPPATAEPAPPVASAPPPAAEPEPAPAAGPAPAAEEPSREAPPAPAPAAPEAPPVTAPPAAIEPPPVEPPAPAVEPPTEAGEPPAAEVEPPVAEASRPAVEAPPVVEAPPAVDEAAVVEEPPAVEAPPAVEVEPPAVEGPPAVEKPPAVEEPPAVEKLPAVEVEPLAAAAPAPPPVEMPPPAPRTSDDLLAVPGLEGPPASAAPAGAEPPAPLPSSAEALRGAASRSRHFGTWLLIALLAAALAVAGYTILGLIRGGGQAPPPEAGPTPEAGPAPTAAVPPPAAEAGAADPAAGAEVPEAAGEGPAPAAAEPPEPAPAGPPEPGEPAPAGLPEPGEPAPAAPQEPAVAGAAGAAPAEPPAPLTGLNRITWNETEAETVLALVGDGAIPRQGVELMTIAGAEPRLVIKIAGVQRPFQPAVLEVGTSHVRRVRTGLQASGELHVVVDLAAVGVGVRDLTAAGSRLEVRLGAE